MQYNYSIIIPHYNSAESLERLLTSIPEREDIQVIIIDDCSTRNLLQFNELRNRFKGYIWLITEKNRGAGHARNSGIKYALGRWVIFADADDYFSDRFNDILNDYIDCYLDIIFFNVNLMFHEGSKRQSTRFNNFRDQYLTTGDIEHIKFKNTYPWGKFYKLSLIQDYKIKFSETYMANDVMFSLKADFFSDNIKIDKRVMYNYSVGDNSLCCSVNSKYLWQEFKILCLRYKFLKDNSLTNWNDKSYLGHSVKKLLKKSWINMFGIYINGIYNGVSIKHLTKYVSQYINSKVFKEYIKNSLLKNYKGC